MEVCKQSEIHRFKMTSTDTARRKAVGRDNGEWHPELTLAVCALRVPGSLVGSNLMRVGLPLGPGCPCWFGGKCRDGATFLFPSDTPLFPWTAFLATGVRAVHGFSWDDARTNMET